MIIQEALDVYVPKIECSFSCMLLKLNKICLNNSVNVMF